MKYLSLVIAFLYISNVTAFTYMGNESLRIQNASGHITSLSYNESYNLSNSSYYLTLESRPQDINISLIESMLTTFVNQILISLMIIAAVFYAVYKILFKGVT